MNVSHIENYNASGGEYTDLHVYIEPGDGSEWEFTVSMDNHTFEILEPDNVRWSPHKDANFDDFAPPAMPPEVAVAWAAKRPEVIAELEKKKAELQAEIDDAGANQLLQPVHLERRTPTTPERNLHMNKKLKITLEIEYALEDTPLWALRGLAKEAVDRMLGKGAFTGGTDALIEGWDLRIEEVEIAEPTYRIVRKYANHPAEVIAEGLTLAEAQEHCRDPETSSRTATEAVNVKRTREMGPWFDCYEEK